MGQHVQREYDLVVSVERDPIMDVLLNEMSKAHSVLAPVVNIHGTIKKGYPYVEILTMYISR